MLTTDTPFDAERLGLAELQEAFAAAVMRPEGELPAVVDGRSQSQRIKRFNVYRNNVHASLAAALAARFPVVKRLVGDEFFRAMTLVYIKSNLPCSPMLSEYGQTFPSFVEKFEPVSDLPYLPDVARLEWARNRAYHAADAVTLAITSLAEIAPRHLAGIRLLLHPAAAFVASPYPIVSIWATNTHDATVKQIGPHAEGQCALVTRPSLDVLVSPMPDTASPFVAAIATGEPLGDAAEKAHAAASGFDLSATLVALFRGGGISEVLLAPDPFT